MCDNCKACKEHQCHSTFTESPNYKKPSFKKCTVNCHFCRFVAKVLAE